MVCLSNCVIAVFLSRAATRLLNVYLTLEFESTNISQSQDTFRYIAWLLPHCELPVGVMLVKMINGQAGVVRIVSTSAMMSQVSCMCMHGRMTL